MAEASEALSLFLEAALAFLGFGALVSLFGKSTDSTEAGLAAARLRCMLELNLAVMVCALLPTVLRPWFQDDALMWRTACLGPFLLAFWAGIVFSARTRPFRSATPIWVRRTLQAIGPLTAGFSILGVLSNSAPKAMACFVVALFLALVVSGAFFALVTSVAFRLASKRRPSVVGEVVGEARTA